MEKKLTEIAQKILNLDTLETRNSDDLDFTEQPIWAIRSALQAAYSAGINAKAEYVIGSGAVNDDHAYLWPDGFYRTTQPSPSDVAAAVVTRQFTQRQEIALRMLAGRPDAMYLDQDGQVEISLKAMEFANSFLAACAGIQAAETEARADG